MKGVWAVPVIFSILFFGSLGLTPNAYAATGTVVWLNPAEKLGKIAEDGCGDESCWHPFQIPKDLVDPNYSPAIGDKVTFEPAPGNTASNVEKTPEGSTLIQSGVTIDGITVNGFTSPQINDNGDLVFEGLFGFLDFGIFTPTSLLVKAGDTIDGKTLTFVTSPQINNNGDVVFRGNFVGGGGIFTPTLFLVGIGDTIDGKTLIGSNVGLPQINNNGDIVFSAHFSGGNAIFILS